MKTEASDIKVQLTTNSYDLWLGQDEASYFELMSKQIEGESAKITEDDIRQAYAERDDDGFHGYGHMVSLLEGTNIALLNIGGSMASKESFWSYIFGTPSYEGISNALIAAAMHPEVKGIIMNWDSPGGPVRGISRPLDTIKALRKDGLPIFSYTSDAMMSAAYWIGSASEKVNASADSEVGSIGVLAIHRDMSAYYKTMGIKHSVFRAGEFKALINPFEPLSGKAKELIHTKLAASYNNFVNAVADNRGQTPAFIKAKAAEGREFTGEEAKNVQLVDAVASFEETVSSLTKRIERKEKITSRQPFGANTMPEVDPKAAAASLIGATGLTAEAAADALREKGIGVEENEDTENAAGTDVSSGGDSSDEGEDAAAAASASDDSGAGDQQDDEGTQEAASADAGNDKGGDKGQESSALVKMLGELQTKVTDLTIANRDLTKDKESLEAAAAGYRQITVDAIGRMRIGLGRAASVDDLAEASHTTVVAAYTGLVAEVMKAYPTSQQSRTQEGEGTKIKANHLTETLNNVTRLSLRR